MITLIKQLIHIKKIYLLLDVQEAKYQLINTKKVWRTRWEKNHIRSVHLYWQNRIEKMFLNTVLIINQTVLYLKIPASHHFTGKIMIK